jgi:hypothetical protein
VLDGRLSLGLVPHVQSGISAQTEVFQSIIIIIIIVSNVIRGPPPPLHQACIHCMSTTRVSFWAASTASASLRGFSLISSLTSLMPSHVLLNIILSFRTTYNTTKPCRKQ